MAKTPNSANPLDAAMSFVAQRTSSRATDPAITPLATLTEQPAPAPEPTPAPAPVQVVAIPGQPFENQQSKTKKDTATFATNVDYASIFLQPVRGRKPKAIYVTENLHTALVNITQATLDGVGLSDLLINIITHHFETFGPGIRQFLTAQEKLRKNNLPY